MAITKSAKKATIRSSKNKIVNDSYKNSMKFAIREFNKIDKSDKKQLMSKLSFAQKRIEKAAKRNIISSKSASRKISSLMKSITKITN